MLSQVLFLLIFFLTICSGSVCAAVFCSERFERALPLTPLGMVLLMFLFGACGILLYGMYILLLLCALIYVVSAVYAVRKKLLKRFCSCFFTPAFYLFTLAFLFIVFINYGRLAYSQDEFSHWADCVRAMTMIDDFITNPASRSLFNAYPPGMALFQYFFVKLNYMLTGVKFCEWLLYLCYQCFFVSLFFPFLDGLDIKKPVASLISAALLFCCPMVFCNIVYCTLYIDSIVGIMAGVGFAMIIRSERGGILAQLRVLLTIFVLVLMKDAGIFFSVFLAAAYCLVLLFNAFARKISARSALSGSAAAVLSVMLPKLIWSHEIAVNNVAVKFTAPVDLRVLLDVLLGRDNSYLSDVAHNYSDAFFNGPLDLVQISTNYFAVFVAFVLALVCLYRLLKMNDAARSRARLIVFSAVLLSCGLYSFGLCVIYMFKFSQYEALILASFDRYLSMGYTAALIVIVVSLVDYASTLHRSRTLFLCTALVLLCFTLPWYTVFNIVTRERVEYSEHIRESYDSFSERIGAAVGDKNPNCLFVTRDSTGLPYYTMRYTLRPYAMIDPPFKISAQSGLAGTYTISCEKLRERLISEYDYVIIFDCDEHFKSDYAELFPAGDEIYERSLYSVDKSTGSLIPVTQI